MTDRCAILAGAFIPLLVLALIVGLATLSNLVV